MKMIRRCLSLLLCTLLLATAAITASAAEDVERRLVKVGFFSADGYHEMDDEGTMSGYGYDFLQMMLRYNNWEYEYVGYDKNWGDMLDMLRNGKIDMVTLANKTTEREAEFDYSDKSVGTSSTIMKVSAINSDIVPGDYSTYSGKRVGLVTGSSHNAKFEEYAADKGFEYTPVYYDDISQLLEDLRAGKNVDIAVTSNMRLVSDEIILDEFNSTEYYAIVRKGEDELLSEINNGLSQLSVYSPDWRTSLFEKYYSDIDSRVISFSSEEREFLQSLKDSGTVIKAAINPELRPYSYFEDGEAKGIAPTVFAEIASRLGIEYEILPSADRWEYKEQLNSGEADIDLTAYLDYSLAQEYNLKETDAYINSTMAMLSSKSSGTDRDSMVVAVVRDPTEYIGFNDDLIYPYSYKEYESIQECIDAVKSGDADATFRYVYIAEQAVKADYTNQLQYTIMPDYAFSLCIGVNNEEDHRLLSVLNKGVNSLPSSFTQGIMLTENAKVDTDPSIIAIAYDYPVFTIAVVVAFVLVLCFLILMFVINRAQKNKLHVSGKMNRFIGYVCESYDLVSEINMKTRQQTDYKMVDGKLVEETHPSEFLEKGYIDTKVSHEDAEKIHGMISAETIKQMINEGGAQKYIECQVMEESGEYNWYSYLIKAVERDSSHPDNFVIFKKNIQNAKTDEEHQKQILRDALETAKTASAAKGQFLSRMSHEIRTPLNAVIGYMQIAENAGDNHAKIMHCISNSDIAARHLLNIINDVLDISSIENGRMKIAHEEFNLKDLISSVSAIFFNQSREKKIKFNTVLENVTQEWIIGDSLRVNQVLMNLLSNAVKFTPEGGEVKLSVSQINTDDKRVYMKFSVSDTGIGMSDEYKERMFRPFEQESAVTAQKYGGTGLGLSITANLVDLMRGSIEARSKQNEGSVFVVSLNFERSFKKHEEIIPQEDYSGVRVLIVDDDEAACEYMKSLLKRCKVKCDTVSDGTTALKRIKGRMTTDYPYDMCIMDWNMPEMNGIETAKKIREECSPDMPIIIATAYDVSEFQDKAQEIGVNRVISKPLFQSTMFDLLVSTYGRYVPAKPKEKNLESIKGLRVLLAEDNPMNLEIAIEILEKSGLYVDSVTDGRQAADKFIASAKGFYDAVLMDIQMPVMDGYQATAVIRKSAHPEAASIPIIAMTANAFTEDVNAALASGMNGHIAKPVDYDKLYEVLDKFCTKNKQ